MARGGRTTLATELAEDLRTIQARDPSVISTSEALLHPALPAVWAFRVAHRLHRRGHRRLARVVAQGGKVLSGGAEIHPGATIGQRFFLDHGAGVVIGETAVLGDDVTLFHQVTLGSVGWWHPGAAAGGRRHPQLGDRVIVGANATVLGDVVIGDDCVIGAQALVTESIPSSSLVTAPRGVVHNRREGEVRPLMRLQRQSADVYTSALPTW